MQLFLFFTLAMVLTICTVAVLGVSQNYTCTIGDTARLFSPRSDREHLKDFMKYRAWKENIPFAVIEKGTLTAKCVNHDLKPFCITKVQFQVWNKTHLLLEINNTNYEDSGEYSVVHVFGGLERNHKEIMNLKIKEPTEIIPSHCKSPEHGNTTLAGTPTNSSTVNLKPHPEAGKLKVGQIVGIVLGVIILVALTGLFYYLYKKMGRREVKNLGANRVSITVMGEGKGNIKGNQETAMQTDHL